jgi:hypothetical protein
MARVVKARASSGWLKPSVIGAACSSAKCANNTAAVRVSNTLSGKTRVFSMAVEMLIDLLG